MDVVVTVVVDSILAPPLVAVHQPSNENPERVGVGSSPYVSAYVTVFDEGDTDTSDALALNVTVYWFAVHYAM